MRSCSPLLSFVFRILIALCVVCLFACSGPSLTGEPGSGSGVGNGVVALGKILYPDSSAVSGALVRLRPKNFVADTSGTVAVSGDGIVTTHTDSAGCFFIDSIDTAMAYSLEVSDGKDAAMGTLIKFSTDTSDTVRLPVRIAVSMPDLVGTVVTGLPANSYVQIFGLERISKTDSAGTFRIKHLPRGDCEENECEYDIRVLVPQPGGGYHVRRGEFEISTEDDDEIEIEVELEKPK